MLRLEILTVMLGLATVAGCNTRTIGSCDSRPGKTRCSDFLSSYPGGEQEAKKYCAEAKGSWADTPCSRTGATGACKSETVVGWEYGMSLDRIKEECFGSVVGPDGN